MKLRYFLPAWLAVGGLLSCSSNNDKLAENTAAIVPVDLPNPHVAGFSFPDTVSIPGWVQQQRLDSISLHGWGLWTALTTRTSQVDNGDTLLVYQTWQTKEELLAGPPPKTSQANLEQSGRRRKRLHKRPAQFTRSPRLSAVVHTLAPQDSSAGDLVLEEVAYNPSAAHSISRGRLFHKAALDSIQKAQLQARQAYPDLTNFGTDAIAIKPMYEVVPGPAIKHGLYKMKVWTGTPTGPVDTAGYDLPKWPGSVYVDIYNHGQGHGQVSKGNAPATPATTYNLNDFIHYALDAEEAAALNAAQDTVFHPHIMRAHAGDYVILVGMHITTNEIANWTWQTMWWSPNPDYPYLPSSAGTVAARPQQLAGAARHYAMSIGYQMITPAAKPTPTNQGQSLYVFNPYLEAPFDIGTFSGNRAVVYTKGVLVVNNVGIRTNCMSCHMQASYPSSPGYIADTDLSPQAPKFKGLLRTDFLWSIPDVAH